ncbi:hypothetical protein Dimus_028906, partial [Dionaea muscipula]
MAAKMVKSSEELDEFEELTSTSTMAKSMKSFGTPSEPESVHGENLIVKEKNSGGVRSFQVDMIRELFRVGILNFEESK